MSDGNTSTIAEELTLSLGSVAVRVRVPDAGMARRLRAALPSDSGDEPGDNTALLRVTRMTGGFALAHGDTLVATKLPLGEVVPRIQRVLRSQIERAGDRSLLPGALVPLDGGESTAWVLPDAAHHYLDTALALAKRFDGAYSGGVQLQGTGTAESPGLPLAVTTAVTGEAGHYQHGRGVDTAYYLAPSRSGRGPFEATSVILPGGSDDAAAPRALDTHTSLAAIIKAAAAAGDAGLDAEAVSRLAEWLEQRPVFGVPADAGEHVLDALATRLAGSSESVDAPV